MARTKLLDINQVTVGAIAKIPGLNKELAERIVSEREDRGLFYNLTGLTVIPGITQTIVDELKKYATVSTVTVMAASPLSRYLDPLHEKFRSVYSEHETLIEDTGTYIRSRTRDLNPSYDDTTPFPDADQAYSEYVKAVTHVYKVLEEDPNITFVDTYRIEQYERKTYRKPVLICRRLELERGATFVVGKEINPTITIIAEEIDMHPEARWEWQYRHPVQSPPGYETAPHSGQPNFDPFYHTPQDPETSPALSGGDGHDGLPGRSPDIYHPGTYDACEPPTVQIIALRIVNLSEFNLRGQNGARGGPGQNGGNGGDGNSGRSSETGAYPCPGLPWIPIRYCKEDPGFGGNGGDGGNGGNGGDGGGGGNGGTLRIFTTPDSWQALLAGQWDLVALIEGGDGGAGGIGGMGGYPGGGGEVGAVTEKCEAEHARPGFDGNRGEDGHDGHADEEGDHGLVSNIVITDFDFALLRDLPILEGLEPSSGPPGERINLIGQNLENADFIVFSTYPHSVPIITDPVSSQRFFNVPDAPGGWAEVSILDSGYEDPLRELEVLPTELDFMTTPRIDTITPSLPDRALWIDEIILDGVAFRPTSDRVRVSILGNSYYGIIDRLQPSTTRIVFRLPQKEFIDHPQDDWDVTIINIDGYRSNSITLGLHSCRAIPFRPMPLIPDDRPSDYLYWPNGFYFQNFAQGLPDWDLFVDTYGKRQIGERVTMDTLHNAVLLANLPVMMLSPTPTLTSLGSLLTLPGTISYYYLFWHLFLNGTIATGQCTGVCVVALLDYLSDAECFLRPWNGTDFQARRLITLASSRGLSREVLFDTMYEQCVQEANNIQPTYDEVRASLDEATSRDDMTILFFIPSGELTEQGFLTALTVAHAVVPYMVVENIATAVDVGMRQVNRIYVYDSNRPFSPYDAALPAAAGDVRNPLRPHPNTWNGLPNCTTGAPPCFQLPGVDDNGVHFVSVWDESEVGNDWRFHYDDGTHTSGQGFTLGFGRMRPFTGEDFVTFPAESWFGLIRQLMELVLSPVTVTLHRLHRDQAHGLGPELLLQKICSPESVPQENRHEVIFIPMEERGIARLVKGLSDDSAYSYRSLDERLDVSFLNMPINKDEEDILITEADLGLVEIHTKSTATKYGNLLLQHTSGEGLAYIYIRGIAFSNDSPFSLRVNSTFNSFVYEGGIPDSECDVSLFWLSHNGQKKQHKQSVILRKDGTIIKFENWRDVCSEELKLPHRDPHWILRDQIDMNDSPAAELSRERHGYISIRSSSSYKSKSSTSVPAEAVHKAATTARHRAAVEMEPEPSEPLKSPFIAYRRGRLRTVEMEPEPSEPLKSPFIAYPRGRLRTVEMEPEPSEPLEYRLLDRSRGDSGRLAHAMQIEWFFVKNIIPGFPLKLVRLMSTRGSNQLARVYVNGQRVTRQDWIVEEFEQEKSKADRFGPGDLPKSIITSNREFVVPGSYITTAELAIRVEILKSDFPLDSLAYSFYQDIHLEVVDVFEPSLGMDANVKLDNGMLINLETLLDISKKSMVSVKGLHKVPTSDGFKMLFDKARPYTPSLKVIKVKRDKAGRPLRIFLNNSNDYSLEDLYEYQKIGKFRLQNAWLVGTPKDMDIFVSGERGIKPFEDSIKPLFKSRPQQQSGK
jgi:hypothetical protein